MPGPLGAGVGWLLFTSLCAVTGAVAVRWIVLPRGRDGGGVLLRRTAALGLCGAAALVLSMAGLFARQLLDFRDPFVPWREDAHLLLTATPWGTTWLAGAAAAVLLVAAFSAAAGGKGWGWGPATVLTLGVGAFPAFTGHANAGDLRGFTVVADTLHVWAAGGWMGGLLVVLVLEGRHRRGGAGTLLPVLVPRFSPLAQLSVAILATTGIFASWVHMGGWSELLTTPYGRLLTLKLVLVAGVLALGAVNARRWTPHLGVEEGQAGLRRTALWELTLGGTVLLATALLVHTSPG